MTPSQELKTEHEGILTMLRILEKICQQGSTSGSIPKERLEQIIEFLKVFVDRCHHGKEEEALFPALEEAGISKEHGPIGVMLEEHRKGRELVREMTEALSGLREDSQESMQAFRDASQRYILLLRQHIDKENHVLFPMGDHRLSPATQRRIEQQFEQLEKEKIGEGKHESYHRLMNSLAEIYL